MRQYSGWYVATCIILFVCMCCACAAMVWLVYELWAIEPNARVQTSPSPTRVFATNAQMGAPSFIRTPTRVTNPYRVIIPTPTAPPLVYPITFNSDFRVVTYTVTGKTLNEISRSLEANAMPDPAEPGSRYYALTRWHLASDWSVRPTLRGCSVEAGTIRVAITMTLPALVTPNVPADAHQRFNTFLERTLVHESDHVTIILQGARAYQHALGNHPPAGDCETLKTQLNDLFRQSFHAINRANREYDAKTQHGRTQGAVFP